jgi:hypothetical protein
MKGMVRAALVVTALLALPSVATAYDIQVIIDGSAIKPTVDVRVDFIVDGGTNSATFYCSFNANGQMTGVSPIFSAKNYTVQWDAGSGSSFMVRGLTDGLKEVKAWTGYGNQLSHTYSGSGRTSAGNIGIYKDHIAY